MTLLLTTIADGDSTTTLHPDRDSVDACLRLNFLQDPDDDQALAGTDLVAEIERQGVAVAVTWLDRLVLTDDDKVALLASLIETGLSFGQVVEAFAARQDETADAYIGAAREVWHRDGEIEIDDNPVVAGSGDNGDYVMAWVWVSNSDADLPDDDDDDDDQG